MRRPRLAMAVEPWGGGGIKIKLHRFGNQIASRGNHGIVIYHPPQLAELIKKFILM